MPKLYKLRRGGIAYYFGSWDNMNRAIDNAVGNPGWNLHNKIFMQMADFAVDTKTNTILKSRNLLEDLLDNLT